MATDNHQALLLEEYCELLADNPQAAPPAELDRELVRLAQRIYSDPTAADARPNFAGQLEQRLTARAAQMRPHHPARRVQSWLLPRLVGTAAFVTLLVASLFFANMLSHRQIPGGNIAATPGPLPSVQELSGNAARVYDAGLITSFVLTETSREQTDTKYHAVWYQAPNLWRSEEIVTNTATDGKIKEVAHTIQVSNGQTLWDYNVLDQQVTIDVAPSKAPQPISPLMLGKALPFAKVTGTATINGRPVYVVNIDDMPATANVVVTHTVWVDQQLYAIVQSEQSAKGGMIDTRAAVNAEYNTPIDKLLFTFTPPASAVVQDNHAAKDVPSSLGDKLDLTLLQAVADALKMDRNELVGKLKAGTLLLELIKSRGISADDLHKVIIANARELLNQAVVQGTISEAAANNIQQQLESADLNTMFSLDKLNRLFPDNAKPD